LIYNADDETLSRKDSCPSTLTRCILTQAAVSITTTFMWTPQSSGCQLITKFNKRHFREFSVTLYWEFIQTPVLA